MLIHPAQSSEAPAFLMESMSPCVRHCRLWLALSGLAYGATAREAFARAHPAMFGRAYEVTLRGYERWRSHHHIADSLDAFAWFLSPRHERWLASVDYGGTIAPCLLGDTSGQPCWRLR